MSTTKVPLAEFVRQLRAAGPVLIERWIAAALADPDVMPTDFEVGARIDLLIPLVVEPMNAPAPNRIACDNCRASLEFTSDATQEEVALALGARGWTATKETLLCPRCKATAHARN